MTVIVHIWPRLNSYVGHTSLTIKCKGGQSVYASFWPVDAAGEKDVKVKRTHTASYPSAHWEDKDSEGGRPSIDVRIPSGLDETKMIAAWEKIKSTSKRYNLIRYNCSNAIAELLQIGSQQKPSFQPRILIKDWVNSPFANQAIRTILRRDFLEVWSPAHILQYAQEIEDYCRRNAEKKRTQRFMRQGNNA